MPDNRHLLVHHDPRRPRPGPPEPPRVPIGPDVYESSGKATQVATYEDLLKTAFDEKVFDYYAASQLVEVDIATGAVAQDRRARDLRSTPVPRRRQVSPGQPDQAALLLQRPLHRISPTPMKIWDKNGKMVKVIADLPPSAKQSP